MLNAMSAENQRSDNTVSSLSPALSLDKQSHDSQMPAEAREETKATTFVLGSHMHTLKAKPTSHENPVDNPSHTNKPTNTPLSPNKLTSNPILISKPTSTSLSPKRRNLKRIARAQNGGPQSSDLKQQNPTRLIGSKRAATDECLNENVNKPQKKQRESCPTETQKIERSAVSAKQHRREQ